MMNLLEFVFQSGWTFFGVFLWVALFLDGLKGIARAIFSRQTICVERVSGGGECIWEDDEDE